MDQLDIIQYLSGQAGREESAKVEAWIAESKENAMTFHRWKSVWESAGAIAPVGAPNVDQAWEKLLPEVEQSTKVIPFYQRWKSMAAAVIFLLGLSYFGWRYFYNDPKMIMAATEVGQTLEVELPDGSKVWLNEQTQLSYPKSFRKNKREVILEGEAFFEVERDEKAPFLIEGQGGQVEVLGTSFVVRSHPDSAEVEVKTGKVALYEKGKTKDTGLILVAGERGKLDLKNGQFQKDTIQDPNYLAWQNKVIEFEHTPIKEVEQILEKVYKTDLIIENPAFYNCLLTARFEQEQLSAIMESIAFLFQIEVVREGQNYRIRGGEGC